MSGRILRAESRWFRALFGLIQAPPAAKAAAFLPKLAHMGKCPYILLYSLFSRESGPAFRPIPRNTDLRRVLCAKHPRTVANDDTISFNNHGYQLLLANRRLCLVGEKVTVQEWFDGSVHIFHSRVGEIPFRLTRNPPRRPQNNPNP